MDLKYHLVALSSDIVEDDFEAGEGVSTGCGYNRELIGQTFDSLKAMIAYLASCFGLSEDPSDYGVEGNRLCTSKMVADHSNAQNGGWFEPTEEEKKSWRRGNTRLYSENFSIHFLRCV